MARGVAVIGLGVGVLATGVSSTTHAAPSGFSALFAPDVIGPGSATRLTFTIENADPTPVTGMAFTDNLPAGVTVASAADVSNACGGTLTASPGSSTISLTDGVVGGSSSCAIGVNVTSSTLGVATNVTSDLTYDGGVYGTATDDLEVDIDLPGFTKSFSPTTVSYGDRTTLTYVIDNTASAVDADFVIFRDQLPAGLVVADPTNASHTCDPAAAVVLSAEPGDTLIDFFAAGDIAAGQSCAIEVDVRTASVGTVESTSGSFSVDDQPSGFAVASIDLTHDDLIVTHDILGDPVVPGDAVVISYTVLNRSRSTDMSSIAFSHDLGAVVTGLAASGLPVNDTCGTGSSVAGSSIVTLSGATLAAGERCTFDVDVTVPVGATHGVFTSTVDSVASDAGTFAPSRNALTVGAAPSLDIEFIDDPVGAGDDVTLRYTLTNNDPLAVASEVEFTHPYGDVLPIHAPDLPNYPGTFPDYLPAEPCGAGSNFSVDTLNGVLYVYGGSLGVGESCTFDAVYTLPTTFPTGSFTTTTDPVEAVMSGALQLSATASADIVTVAAPTLSKQFTESAVLPGDEVSIEYTITADGALIDEDESTPDGVSDITFTDDLGGDVPGLAATNLPLADVCGAGSALSGTSIVTLSTASLAPGTTCTFTVTGQLSTGGTGGTYTSTTSEISATVGGVATTGPAATDELDVGVLTLTKEFTDDPATPGGTVTLEFTIDNTSTSLSASDIFFTDDLDAELAGLTMTGPAPTDPCGAGSGLVGTTYLTFFDGTLAPDTSCTFSVTLDVPAAAANGEYRNTTGSLSASMNGSPATYSPASDLLRVEGPQPVLASLDVIDDPQYAGGTATLELTVENADTTAAASSISVDIDLDEAISGLVAVGLPISDGCGAGSTVSGTSLVQLTGGSLAPGASCTIQIELAIPAGAAASRYVVTSSAPTADVGGNATVGIAAQGDLVIANPGDVFVTIDRATGQADPANASPILFDVVFTDAVTGFVGTDVELGGTAAPTTAVVTGSGTDYTVAVSGMTGDGTVIASIPPDRVRSGVADTNAASTSTDNEVVYDTTPPTVTIDQAAGQPDPTTTNSFLFDVVFSEPVTGFTAADVTVGGTSGATTVNVSGASPGTDFVVTVSGATNDGTVVPVVSAGAALDAAGNLSLASTSTDNQVVYDVDQPTVTVEQAATQADPTNVDSFVFDVVFSETVSGFTASDVTIGGTAGATTATISGSGAAYTVTVSGATSDGTVTVSLGAGAATDVGGRSTSASTSVDNLVTLDTSLASVTVEQAATQADPTNVDSFVFDVEFSAPVTGFDAADVRLVGSAPGGSVGLSGSGSAYVVTVTGITGDGTVVVTVPGGSVLTASGQSNVASTSADNEVEYDTAAPIITVPPSPVTASTDAGEAGANVAFSVSANDPDAVLSPLAASSESLVVGRATCSPSSGSFFSIGSTTVTCSAMDDAGNRGSASFQVVVVDDEAPSIATVGGVQGTAAGANGTAIVTYATPTVTDNGGPVTVTCAPPSGSAFPVGNTTVTCTAVDSAGNESTTTFVVSVAAIELPATGGGLDVLRPALGVLLIGFGLYLLAGTRRTRPT